MIVEHWNRAILILFFFSALVLPFAAAQAQGEEEVLVLTLEGPLTPAMQEYLSRGIKRAEERSTQLIILQLDTPGGSITIMQDMVSVIRSSSVPVIVYVSPRGAIAGSAGTVITLAGHKAAMAPETAIGAASPVGSGGQELGETIKEKSQEIIKAQIRSLASERGDEAVAFAEETVESAKAATAQEALNVGLVDVVAVDLADLLDQVHGQTLNLNGRTAVLNTRDVEPQYLSLSLIEQVLATLTNPNIVFLLLIIGVQAILIEISHPGGWAAGFIGVVCLALAVYGLGILPVNWFGIIFLITAFVLFLLDTQAPTHGALTTAGVASLIVGALVLFNSPGTPTFQRVSVWLVITGSALSGGLFAVIMAFALQTKKEPIKAGRESLQGQIGFVRSEISRHHPGQVQVGGERWSAKLAPDADPLVPGERIEVIDVSGNYLRVQKCPPGE